MSGPNVVDKGKMVFHYVAKIAARPSNSSDITDSSVGQKEMKVCFRHSKHSIKCDISAPCSECDSNMKLYSYEQCRRHLDVVRSEKRFESIEVDRSENMIEKLLDIDENGKRIAHLLEMIVTKQDKIVSALTDLSSSINESNNKTEVVNTHPKRDRDDEEDKIIQESINSTLKEISRNTLRSHKKQEEISAQLSQCHSVLVDLSSNGQTISNNSILSHSQLSEVNKNLALISGKIEENTTHLKEASATQSKTYEELQASNDKLFEEIVQIKSTVAEFINSLKDQLNLLKSELINELQLSRNELINNQNLLREEITTNITSVKEEVESLKNLSKSFADEIKDSLPEKLMDVFGSILMLSSESGRKLDNNEECGTANTSFASQYLLNNKNDY